MTTDVGPDGLVGARVAFDIADHTGTVEGTVTVVRVSPRGTEVRVAYESAGGRLLHRWLWVQSVRLIEEEGAL